MTGASEFFTLAHDFGRAPAKVAATLYSVFKQSGETFAEDWRKNATETSGSHAKDYPDFITSETQVSLGISVVTGPESRGQGQLGRVLEFGGLHSPAHLDGARALPVAEKRLERAADLAVAYALP